MEEIFDWKIARDNMFKLRLKANLNQTELGEQLGVSAAVICSYENGRVIPKISFMEKFCYFFGIGMDDLYKKDMIKEIMNL